MTGRTAKFNDIRRRIIDEIEDQNIQNTHLARTLTFHATSIFDHTIYEAFSNVVMRLIPSDTLGQYENLLNSLHLVNDLHYSSDYHLTHISPSLAARNMRSYSIQRPVYAFPPIKRLTSCRRSA